MGMKMVHQASCSCRHGAAQTWGERSYTDMLIAARSVVMWGGCEEETKPEKMGPIVQGNGKRTRDR